ncbi:hypothetical protein SAMN04487944_1248 [Gracilibacillus ureilyticus]|uniref:Uncharacterized protein n=1 Tax=Gracilibacillus ureilyticus TaxID=531814 RepID=A0A1H9VI12_9BACI|nr:hypothetical protein [Gracilibacillus ureilyticus]SES21426.1 hypothetical protein SAMN04487944_1248 [Gracilibacillus ureilyticus]
MVIQHLRREKGHITREASDYLLEQNKKSSELFKGIRNNTYDDLWGEIERTYQEQLQKIEEEYEENVEV